MTSDAMMVIELAKRVHELEGSVASLIKANRKLFHEVARLTVEQERLQIWLENAADDMAVVQDALGVL